MKKKIHNKPLHDKLNDLINEYPEYLELDDEIDLKHILNSVLRNDMIPVFYNNKQGEWIEITKTQFNDFVLHRVLTYFLSIDDHIDLLSEVKEHWGKQTWWKKPTQQDKMPF
ncbi:MAG: hypothetical protein ACK5C5_03440 [Bacteroidota bacterium]|jgi:hypothetical protein